MGRIKTKLVKAKTRDFLEAHGDKFSTDFSANKKVISEHSNISSKKIRNAMAGYLVRIKKAEKNE